MPEKRPPPGSPEDWLRIARGDLGLAKIERPAGVPSELLCFHAQQAAEKAIKAVIVVRGMPVPPIHNIEALLKRLSETVTASQEVREAVLLTKYAVISRYPADIGAVDTAEPSRWPRRWFGGLRCKL